MTKLTYEHLILLIISVLLAILPLIAVVPKSWALYVFIFCVYLSMSCMWNLIAGYSGLISLCQPAFLGLAGYTLALGTWVHVPWWAGLIGGAIVAGIFVILIAFAVFRLSGVYFAIGTLVVPEALRSLFILWRPVGGPMTGGGAGYMIKFDHLFSPLKVGRFTYKNRIESAPMAFALIACNPEVASLMEI